MRKKRIKLHLKIVECLIVFYTRIASVVVMTLMISIGRVSELICSSLFISADPGARTRRPSPEQPRTYAFYASNAYYFRSRLILSLFLITRLLSISI